MASEPSFLIHSFYPIPPTYLYPSQPSSKNLLSLSTRNLLHFQKPPMLITRVDPPPGSCPLPRSQPTPANPPPAALCTPPLPLWFPPPVVLLGLYLVIFGMYRTVEPQTDTKTHPRKQTPANIPMHAHRHENVHMCAYTRAYSSTHTYDYVRLHISALQQVH